MGETYSCTFTGCGRIFSRPFELRKHKATHDDPNSVFCCPQCNFITLQKKNLRVHIATHTGEKVIQCPDTITIFGSTVTYEERCEYRTNDPAALTKHRKKVHGYIPPPSRSRPTKAAVRKAVPTPPCKPQEKKDGKVVQRHQPYPRPLSLPYRQPSHVSPVANNLSTNVGHTSTATTLPSASVFAPPLWQGNATAYGQPLGAGSSHVPGSGSSNSSGGALAAPYGGMELYPLYDPSLNPDWMATYEMGYSSFDATGMKYHPELVGPSSAPIDFGDTRTGREGCLCPEWMVQAGIEGWDQSVLDAHKAFYNV